MAGFLTSIGRSKWKRDLWLWEHLEQRVDIRFDWVTASSNFRDRRLSHCIWSIQSWIASGRADMLQFPHASNVYQGKLGNAWFCPQPSAYFQGGNTFTIGKLFDACRLRNRRCCSLASFLSFVRIRNAIYFEEVALTSWLIMKHRLREEEESRRISRL